VIENGRLLPQTGTKLANNMFLNVYDVVGLALPPEFLRVSEPSEADLIITNRLGTHAPHVPPLARKRAGGVKKALYLRPRDIVVGVGCNNGTSAEEIESAIKKTLIEHDLSFLSICSVATIDIKTKEPGIREFCGKYSLDIRSFMPEELNSVEGIPRSEAVFRATGAKAVAEPAALLAAGADKLLVPKQKIGNVTVAAAEIRGGVSEVKKEKSKAAGMIFVVGTGPGDISHITPYAQKAIRGSDIIVGYGTYLELIKDLVQGKEVFSTGMTQEIDRCRKAVELACEGKTVSVISGGDPGIYAMAGLVLELLRSRGAKEPGGRRGRTSDISSNPRTLEPLNPVVEVIPGISALNACAARLGAPLMHDFASISLSDRLTPWDTIEKRLDAAAMADFVIALYNPKSKGRTEQINRAREIFMKYRAPETPVGIVRGAMRENEVVVITDLKNMINHEIDMQTTVIIGNSNTLTWNGLMITPRGYEKKRQFRVTSRERMLRKQ
jgi:cobalt-precorrin 5A hydrolase/precorrin-3B C17-methyltransferase